MPDDETEKKVPKFALIKRFKVADDISLVDKAACEEVFLAIKSGDAEEEEEAGVGEEFEIEEGHDKFEMEDFETEQEKAVLLAAAKASAQRVLEAATKAHGVGTAAEEQKQVGGAMDEKGMLERIFQMLGSFLKGKRAEPATKVEEKPKPAKKKYLYLPARASATSAKKEANILPDENELTTERDKEGELVDVEKLLAEVAALKADREERDKRIKALEETVAEDKKSARKSAIQAKVEKFESQGKVSAAGRDLLVHALTGETAAYKSANGKEENLTPEEAMERFVEVNKGIVFGEVTKAAEQTDLGKWDGKTPGAYAEEQMKLANKPIAQA